MFTKYLVTKQENSGKPSNNNISIIFHKINIYLPLAYEIYSDSLAL